jgi:hypothetical protein
MTAQDPFSINDQHLADTVKAIGADSLADAFPAALILPAWRALLARGAVSLPPDVHADRIAVRFVSPTQLELEMPVEPHGQPEVIKSITVVANSWTATDPDLGNQLFDEAKKLARALSLAYQQAVFDHSYRGPGQKPRN